MKLHHLLPLLLFACTPLEPDEGEPTLTGLVVTDEGGGVFRLDVDASDESKWVLFDLGARAVGAQDAWDLGFKRFLVKTNGGASGEGGVRVAAMANTAFGDLDRAPSTGWVEDIEKEDVDSEKPDEILEADIAHAFNQPNDASENGWYDYDPTDHTLSPAPVVFVVQARDGRFYEVAFERYYDDAGSPAILTLRFAEIDGPEATGLEVDATSGWTYLKIGAGVVAAAPDSLDWDVGFSRTVLRTNGGTSGPGNGGAAWSEVDFAAADEVPTIGFVVDEELPVPGPPGSGTISANRVLGEWYDYDPVTHVVSPKDRALLVRGADGSSYGKLQILSYADGVHRVLFVRTSAVPATVRRTVDASDAEAWVHFSLRTGEVVETASASADGHWDVAFSRTRVRTNGGTSGDGDAAAIEIAAPIDTVTAAPAEGYAMDEALPLPGPPGSGTYSGNPVLAAWYDYDPHTHAIAARDVTFVIRTADGSFAKLAIEAFDDGVYTFAIAYAGPNGSTF